MKLTRRHFITGGAALLGALGLGKSFGFDKYIGLPGAQPSVTGKVLGASSKTGHLLRAGVFPEVSDTRRQEVVIVGGGMAGLGAAWRLKKAGLADFALLELEEEAGGNAASGKNATSAYPWGAHYVPFLTEESRAPRKLFEELGVIKGYDAKGLPVYDEYFVCSDPHERLFMYGRWQDGIVPNVGLSADEKRQYASFFAKMEGFKTARGKDKKKAFAIPVDKSSQDPAWLKYDAVTMKEWMDAEGYSSVPLRWYVDYCCRDDYGTGFEDVSAWAGMHYFAARTGVAANAAPQGMVTWPEGNGFLAHKLLERVGDHVIPRALVYAVRETKDGVAVDYLDQQTGNTRRIVAKSVILATPQFVSARLTGQGSDQGLEAGQDFSYAPWAVANITLSRLPEGKGMDLAWDNMVHNSRLLGYVVATHQNTEMNPRRTVITYYWPLNHLPPKEARQEAIVRSYEDWRDIFLAELLLVHPELEGHVEGLDVWVWGHAMIRPTKGFIWGGTRRAALRRKPPVFRAHSDLSGISIFEEAYTHGVDAAERVLAYHKIPHETEL